MPAYSGVENSTASAIRISPRSSCAARVALGIVVGVEVRQLGKAGAPDRLNRGWRQSLDRAQHGGVASTMWTGSCGAEIGVVVHVPLAAGDCAVRSARVPSRLFGRDETAVVTLSRTGQSEVEPKRPGDAAFGLHAALPNR